MPKLITSFIVVTMSKKSRMPERGMSRTVTLRRSRRDTEAFVGGFMMHQDTKPLVGLEHEVSRCRKNSFERRESLADKRGHLAQVATFHEEKQIVGPAHEIRGTDLGESADPVGDGVETAFALWRDLDLDDCGNRIQIELV